MNSNDKFFGLLDFFLIIIVIIQAGPALKTNPTFDSQNQPKTFLSTRRNLKVREIANEVGVSKNCDHRILTKKFGYEKYYYSVVFNLNIC